jgi:hypothetical protein
MKPSSLLFTLGSLHRVNEWQIKGNTVGFPSHDGNTNDQGCFGPADCIMALYKTFNFLFIFIKKS